MRGNLPFPSAEVRRLSRCSGSLPNELPNGFFYANAGSNARKSGEERARGQKQVPACQTRPRRDAKTADR